MMSTIAFEMPAKLRTIVDFNYVFYTRALQRSKFKHQNVIQSMCGDICVSSDESILKLLSFFLGRHVEKCFVP